MAAPEIAAAKERVAGGDRLRLDRQICFPLYAATNLLQRLYRPLLAPLGLTYSQYLVMMLLWERKAAHVGELRDCLHLDAGTITPLLKRMERAGLVTRRRERDDERRVQVALTPRGAALRRRAERIPATLAAQIGAEPDELASLRALTTSLVDRLRRIALIDVPERFSSPEPRRA
jgi:DNA-binding MarR family transcriptional regulator